MEILTLAAGGAGLAVLALMALAPLLVDLPLARPTFVEASPRATRWTPIPPLPAPPANTRTAASLSVST